MTEDNDLNLVTIVKDLSAKVDALQRGQANLISILSKKWKDEDVKRRERRW
jgi:hypothetical protein